MHPSDFQPKQISRKKNIGHESIPGENNYEQNFSEQVVNKISEYNFRKQEPVKITYLKPTKAALYGLHLRFQSFDRDEREEKSLRKAGRRTKEQDSIYMINSQLMGMKKGGSGETSKSLILTSNKKNLDNSLKKAGK